jgi:hypothetical protein
LGCLDKLRVRKSSEGSKAHKRGSVAHAANPARSRYVSHAYAGYGSDLSYCVASTRPPAPNRPPHCFVDRISSKTLEGFPKSRMRSLQVVAREHVPAFREEILEPHCQGDTFACPYVSDFADDQHDGSCGPSMSTMAHKVTETSCGCHSSETFFESKKAAVPEVSAISAIASNPAPPTISVVSATSASCGLSWNPNNPLFQSQSNYIITKSAAVYSTFSELVFGDGFDEALSTWNRAKERLEETSSCIEVFA